MTPRVSVIIPAFNAEEYIENAVISIVEQRYEDLEIIIINDRSTDGTEEKVIKLCRKYPEIVYCENHREKGPSGARNTGLIKATGKYVAFLDADDVWLPGHLKNGVGFLEDEKEIDAVFFNFRVVDAESGETVGDWFSEREFLEKVETIRIDDDYYLISSDIFEALLEESFIHLQSMIVRREACKGVFFNEAIMHAEDRDFAISLFLKSNAKFAFNNMITGIYYLRANSLTSNTLENNISLISDHITLFKSYLFNDKLDEGKERKIRRLLRSRYLSNSYLYRKKREFSMSAALLVTSLRYGACPDQFLEAVKILAEFCQAKMKREYKTK